MVASLASQVATYVAPIHKARGEHIQQQQLFIRFGRGASGVRIRAVSVSTQREAVDGDAEGEAGRSLAYRPVVVLPGLGNNSSDYTSLGASLSARGLSVTVAKVSRPDWLKNAAGLLEADYWAGNLRPRPVLDWYLERVQAAVEEAKAFCPQAGAKISIIGHSAGGWLARLYLGEIGIHDVALLLTLGSPHLPPPKGVKGVVDQTRGLLNYIEDRYPGAFHSPDVKYVCISGRYLKGAQFFPAKDTTVAATGLGTVATSNGNQTVVATELPEESKSGTITGSSADNPAPTFRARLIGQGYKQVCGRSDVWGDGVVPEVSAHLDGALNISMDGVYHSPVGANDDRPWYGSKFILDKWVHHLLE